MRTKVTDQGLCVKYMIMFKYKFKYKIMIKYKVFLRTSFLKHKYL